MKTLLLKGGTVIDNEQGTQKLADVLVENARIVLIGKDIAPPDSSTQVIDCRGLVVLAGYVDAHVHVESSMVLPDAFGEAILPHGTTTIIADPHEVVNVAGANGLQDFLCEAERAPISVFTVVPSSVPATPFDTNGAGEFLASDMLPFVHRADVVGLGEVMCAPDVVEKSPSIMDKISLFKHKTIDGHLPTSDAHLLDAYVEAGIQNDHETYDEDSVLAHYERGFNIYIREGSAARNGETLLNLVKKHKLDIGQFAFCTDDKHLATIAEEGHISYLVAMARRMGFDWCEVSCMASLNPCLFYRLAQRGNIREGYVADIVITDEMGEDICHVIKHGEWVATNRKLRKQSAVCRSHQFENSLDYRNLTAADFVLHEHNRQVAIELVDHQLLTLKATLAEGEWEKLPLLATIERHGKNGNIALCPIKNYGIRGGAVATSVSHDSHNVICAGDSPSDMAVACNRLREIGGGYVVIKDGRVIGELPLPAYGLMATTDAETTARQIHQVEVEAYKMGVNPNIDAFTTLSFVALPVIPSLRLLDTGLYDVEEGHFL